MKTKHNQLTINGLNIFYREAGDPKKETILCLHGFPSSSQMYAGLIEQLADNYHLIAPDYPAFGLSDAPDLDAFEYTFDNITLLVEQFIKAKNLSSFYLLMQDYGGPIGFRIAVKDPSRIKGLIIQNANAYKDGLGEWAMKIGGYQQENDMEGLMNFKDYLMSPEGIKEQYLPEQGTTDKVDPLSYLTATAFMQREGINEKQTALFANYGTNFPLYPEWQAYFKKYQPATLVVWGVHDKFFSKPGADAYTKDLPNARIHHFNGGHFMLDQYAQEVASLIKEFAEY